jgi:hypothetical protein
MDLSSGRRPEWSPCEREGQLQYREGSIPEMPILEVLRASKGCEVPRLQWFVADVMAPGSEQVLYRSQGHGVSVLLFGLRASAVAVRTRQLQRLSTRVAVLTVSSLIGTSRESWTISGAEEYETAMLDRMLAEHAESRPSRSMSINRDAYGGQLLGCVVAVAGPGLNSRPSKRDGTASFSRPFPPRRLHSALSRVRCEGCSRVLEGLEMGRNIDIRPTLLPLVDILPSPPSSK